MDTVSVAPSVASTGTTAVAPAGTGAPVMMRCAVPGFSVSGSVRPGGDVLGDGQQHGLLGCRGGDVVGHHGVPVHRRVVEPGQRQRRHHVVGQHQAECLGERQRDRRLAGDQAGDDAPVFLDGAHQTGNVTPVSSSDTVHSRRWMSSSCDCALDSTTFGWPLLLRRCRRVRSTAPPCTSDRWPRAASVQRAHVGGLRDEVRPDRTG